MWWILMELSGFDVNEMKLRNNLTLMIGFWVSVGYDVHVSACWSGTSVFCAPLHIIIAVWEEVFATIFSLVMKK